MVADPWVPAYIKILIGSYGLRPSEWRVIFEDDQYVHIVPRFGSGNEKLKILSKRRIR